MLNMASDAAVTWACLRRDVAFKRRSGRLPAAIRLLVQAVLGAFLVGVLAAAQLS